MAVADGWGAMYSTQNIPHGVTSADLVFHSGDQFLSPRLLFPFRLQSLVGRPVIRPVALVYEMFVGRGLRLGFSGDHSLLSQTRGDVARLGSAENPAASPSTPHRSPLMDNLLYVASTSDSPSSGTTCVLFAVRMLAATLLS